MGHRLSFIIATIVGIIFYSSCKKEHSCEGCTERNQPPIAIAGPDQVIILPTDSISLDGSQSNDPDGTITEWLWKKISGPASFQISNASVAITNVKSLDTGVYKFELMIKDNGGLSAKDTIQISVNDQSQPNRPPVADAGADQTITLPTNTTNMDGGASTDPDNNITTYQWTKISGPTQFNIVNANSTLTRVTNLTEGVYQFEVKVTDAGGLFSKDTMQVKVNSLVNQPCDPSVLIRATCDNSMRPQVCAQLIPIGTLSGGPGFVEVAFAGNKLVFYNYYIDILDIYDPTLNSWSTADLTLSQPSLTTAPTVIGVGSKVLFAGGEIGQTLPSDVVDIYDVSTNTWAVSHLSKPGMFFSTATCGNKVFFAGGFTNALSNVDIYDASTESWSAASLSAPRGGVTVFSGNNKVYFTGGNFAQISNVIDIYDNGTDTWSTSTMQSPRIFHSGVSVNDILYLAGGIDNNCPCNPYNPTTCSIEILNTITGNRTLMNLFGPAAWQTFYGQNAVVKDGKIIFLRQHGGADANRFDIYDIQSNTWSIGVLPQPIPEGSDAISINNTIYIAGGSQNAQVWKLEF